MEINNPPVSVIIPSYNRYSLTKEAVQSVKEQSYKNMEIILVDDGSTDNTTEFKNMPGIIYIKQKHTGFPGQVRNRGADFAGGEYLAFLDSDDLYKPDKIKKQVEFFKNNSDILICHTREIWLRNNKPVSQAGQQHKRAGNIFKDALLKCIIGPSTVMIRKELFLELGMFNPELEIAEDYELWLRICAAYKIGYIDEPLVIKRAGSWDQLSWKYKQIEIFRIKALLTNIEHNTFTGENLSAAEKELVRKCRIYANGCIKRGKQSEAKLYLKIADKYNR